jgi:putative DNA primase/helicase
MSRPTTTIPGLIPDHLADLRRSGLSDETIIAMNCRSEDAATIRNLTGVKVRTSAYSIPYPGLMDQTGQPLVRWRLSKPVDGMKYLSGKGDDPQLYIPPGFTTLPKADLLVVTEGEKKAAAAVQAGIPCVGIQGVSSWPDPERRAIERCDGGRVSADTPPLQALLDLAPKYMRVLILGDSDTVCNPQARKTLELLASSLRNRGVRAAYAACPPAITKEDGVIKIKKQGLDDWLTVDRSLARRSLPALFYAGEVAFDGINDHYNAREFTEFAHKKVVFSQDRGLHWNGLVWAVDTTCKRRTLVPEIAKVYRDLAERLHNLLSSATAVFGGGSEDSWPEEINCWSSRVKPAIKTLRDAALKIGNLRGVDSTLALAQNSLAVPDNVWDRDPYFLAVKNGVVDLRTCEILPASPEQWITKCAGAIYDPSAKPEKFLTFLEQMQPDGKVRDYLQRLMGYAATGLAREQKLFTFVGPGGNGKGVFVTLMLAALDGYAVKGPVSLLSEQNPDKPRHDLAMIAGARFLSISETRDNLRIDEATIKSMTGEDAITARHLFKNYFTFVPCVTPILDTNHCLMPRDTGQGMWRRLVNIPWPVSIPEDQQNKKLKALLMEDLSGILAWIVEGAKLYLASGLPKLAVLTESTQSLRQSLDDVGRWLDARVVRGEQFRVQASDLYKSFVSWNEAEGNHDKISQIQFSKKLREKGFEPKKRDGGVMVYLGLGLREKDEQVHDSGEPEQNMIAIAPDSPASPSTGDTVYRPHSPLAAPAERMAGGSILV